LSQIRKYSRSPMEVGRRAMWKCSHSNSFSYQECDARSRSRSVLTVLAVAILKLFLVRTLVLMI